MKNYKTNVKDYLSEELLEEETYGIGAEIGWIPFEETEANFCFIDSIKSNGDEFVLTLRVENEFSGEKYLKEYTVQKGSKIEMNTFDFPIMCFLPPDKVPVLAEVKEISDVSVTLQTVAVLDMNEGENP